MRKRDWVFSAALVLCVLFIVFQKREAKGLQTNLDKMTGIAQKATSDREDGRSSYINCAERLVRAGLWDSTASRLSHEGDSLQGRLDSLTRVLCLAEKRASIAPIHCKDPAPLNDLGTFQRSAEAAKSEQERADSTILNIESGTGWYKINDKEVGEIDQNWQGREDRIRAMRDAQVRAMRE